MASNGKWDWFAFYPKDFLTDEKVIVMSAMECGAYVRLLCVAWNSHPIGTLVGSDDDLAKYATLSIEEWTKHKGRIMAPFTLMAGRWHQKRMVEEGRSAEEKHLKFVAAGRRGGNAKWGHSEAGSHPIARLQPSYKPGSTIDSTVTDTIREKSRARACEVVDCADGFGALQAQYPRLDIAKEYLEAKSKIGKEPPRVYFERWLQNRQDKLIPGKPPEEKARKPKRYESDDWMDMITEVRKEAADAKAKGMDRNEKD